ncbi:hypothetical protein FGX00_03845, partial [Xylella fastidiosa subsp. multiplex]|nr:hypothetical protein [Xylella fastidiosa subsp. multiplex]
MHPGVPSRLPEVGQAAGAAGGAGGRPAGPGGILPSASRAAAPRGARGRAVHGAVHGAARHAAGRDAGRGAPDVRGLRGQRDRREAQVDGRRRAQPPVTLP